MAIDENQVAQLITNNSKYDQINRIFSIWTNLTRFNHLQFWKCALFHQTHSQSKKDRTIRIWPNDGNPLSFTCRPSYISIWIQLLHRIAITIIILVAKCSSHFQFKNQMSKNFAHWKYRKTTKYHTHHAIYSNVPIFRYIAYGVTETVTTDFRFLLFSNWLLATQFWSHMHSLIHWTK